MQFPFSNVGRILDKLRPSLERKEAELTDALKKADVAGKLAVSFLSIICLFFLR